MSCLLAAVVTADWARSYRVYDQLSCGSTSERYRCAWKSYAASFHFPAWPPGIPKEASSAVLTSSGNVLLQQAVYIEQPLGETGAHGYAWSSDDSAAPGFSYFYAVTGDMSRSGHWMVRQASFRHWAVLLPFVILPLVWLVAWRRRGIGHAPVRTRESS
jgi:hypothetical protein